MEIEKIKELYHNIPEADLTARERTLMALLSTHSKDFSYLPLGRFRVLQFSVVDFTELVEHLRFILPDVINHDTEKQIVIEKHTGHNLSKSELADSFQALSQDIGHKIESYIGNFTLRDELSDVYAEEARFFTKRTSFSEFTIAQGLNQVESLLLDKFRQEFLKSPEDKRLVQALYRTQGNQAAAAKLLYVHRNTLLNKIKKYEQKYGLQLTGSDLVLAYNLM